MFPRQSTPKPWYIKRRHEPSRELKDEMGGGVVKTQCYIGQGDFCNEMYLNGVIQLP